MKKLNLPDSRKKFLKENFNSIDPKTLTLADEKRYYNLIKAGKSRAKKSIRLEGRFLSGEIVTIIQKVAERKGLSLKKYIDQNSADILKLINQGHTHVFKRVDDVIDLVDNSRKKYFYVNDGNGLLRYKKSETISQLAEFQNYVKTNSDIVEIMINVRIYHTGRIEVTVPPNRELSDELDISSSYEDYDYEQLYDYLDEFEGIEYIVSDKTKKR